MAPLTRYPTCMFCACVNPKVHVGIPAGSQGEMGRNGTFRDDDDVEDQLGFFLQYGNTKQVPLPIGVFEEQISDSQSVLPDYF